MVKVRELASKDYNPKPSISFDARTLPDVKTWKVGGKYRIVIDVKMVSMSDDEYDEGAGISSRFKVLKAKVAKNDKN